MIKRTKMFGSAHSPLKASVSLAVLAAVLSPVTFAQEDDRAITESDVVAEESASAVISKSSEADGSVEEVTVTGSRLKRDSFSSIAPLEIIDTEGAREAGVIDTSSILQNSGAASGQQIDLTFSGYVLDNGPGASTVSLRGLGAGRTLVLLNGRRLAPSGVEGAPTSPDLNLIPASLVQRYDLLLDGASSVYGSDAVAGVTNIILKKDFDGFDFEMFSRNPQQDAGEENTLSLSWGKNFDRGFIGMGAEYYDMQAVTLDDREWTQGCRQNIEVGRDGKIYRDDLYYSTVYGMDFSGGCNFSGGLGGYVNGVPGARSIFYTPGYSNGGWGNFSDMAQYVSGIDGNGDGVTDVNYRDLDMNGREQFAHLLPEQERMSYMAFGEYTFEGDMNLTPFFETLYSKRETFINAGASQLFPLVPGSNPFSICNPDGVRGVDCGLANDALLTNPNFVSDFTAIYGVTPEQAGLLTGPLGAVTVQPVVSVFGDRNTANTEVEHFRFVTGARGDLPMLNVGTMSDWSFELSASYSKSSGASSRLGIREDRLDQSLATTIEDPNNPGSYICEPLPGESTCVPIDMFASSLYDGVVGDFATQAERDYLFDSRDFDTDYYQKIFSAYASGTVASLPAGDVVLGVGAEFRNDRIKSIPDDIARDGLFFGFFTDGGASGNKDTKEVFGEIEIPIVSGAFLAEELTTNLSARYTKDEFYGGAWTKAAKIGYRPVASLLLRTTYGTSYRAPNLRENFLQNQSGFNNITDPCLIPADAIDDLTGYNPDLDNRSPEVLQNCIANGVDPTQLENNNGFYSVEIARGGSRELLEETSDSYTAGFSWEQPFFDSFGLSIGMTYYDIDISNSIIEPSGQFLVNDCYVSPNPSAFCSLVSRNSEGFINRIDAGFVNRDSEVARGFDYNIRYEQSANLFGVPLDLSANLRLNRVLERSLTYVDDNGVEDREDYTGDFGYAKWTGQGEFRVEYDKYRLTWATRYIGSVEQGEEYIDEFSDIFDTNGTGFYSDTCVGTANGGTDCRDVGFADDYFVHNASLYYYADTWTAGLGVNNVFNEAPPEVDGNEILSINNTPIGYGYDLQGRTIFMNVQKNF
ncbi:TonB-dependent receptor [Microbulbifer bruguierae]|uniref:TonB-dependent receptor n=1 Tax=Microbulbifer bruguierae TaxID=3029061 RepID=A0ABY8N9Q6_9GAMM|nr:TonB-dependent receptor [Microbulbifer bruguierae]WGL15385.1 TonB-dependent receptor [Microbulbifer bruguierae]